MRQAFSYPPGDPEGAAKAFQFPASLSNERPISVITPDDYGAIGDARHTGTALSIANGSAALTVTGGDFTDVDVGKVIGVPGAGAAGAGLISTIGAVANSTHVTLNNVAATALSAVAGDVIVGTDDTVALQAAFNAAADGLVLWFQPGNNHLVAGPILVASAANCRIRGNRATISSLFTVETTVLSWTEPVNLFVAELHMDGCCRYGSLLQNSISGANPILTVVEKCTFFDYGGGPLNGGGAVVLFGDGAHVGTGLVGNHIRGCYADGNDVGQAGYILVNVEHSSIADCHVRDLDRIVPNPSFGMDFKDNCRNCHIIGCTAENCDSGFLLTSTSSVDGEGPQDCSIIDFIASGCRAGFVSSGGANCFMSGLVDMQDQGEYALRISAHNLRHEFRIAIRNQPIDTTAIKNDSRQQEVFVTHDGSISGTAKLYEVTTGKGENYFHLQHYATTSVSFNPQSLIVDGSGEISNRYHFGESIYATLTSQSQLRLPAGQAYTRNTWIETATDNTNMAIIVEGHRMVNFNHGDLRVTPGTDNELSNGAASSRWTEVFAAAGAINTSDARLKTAVAPLTGPEIAAAKQLAAEIGSFQFLQAIEDKGEDEARLHIGLTVQRAMEIMDANGLDPLRYGFICYDAWDDKLTDGYDADGNPTGEMVVTTPAGDVYSFRHDELALFIARGLEARLTALEA